MIRYQVRSKELIDLVNEIKSKRLIMSPYFQRNLVWRDIHKVDFIKTILLGLPFPQIFIAKGSIDLESMTTTSCIVDGQQRMSAITEYVANKYKVDGKSFEELSPEVKQAFFKYQIPIIDLDIENEDPVIKDVFQRLNRTFYSLNTIEKMSSEYASSEFMMFAKNLVGEIDFDTSEEEEDSLFFDTTIPKEFVEWAKNNKAVKFKKLIVEGNIFTPYEISRQVHLMYSLNVLSTIIGDIHNRNDLTKRYLEEYKDGFEQRDELLGRLEIASAVILGFDFNKSSYWNNKANMFSLFLAVYNNHESISTDAASRLKNFEEDIPEDYRISAKEGVNNRKERLTRKEYIEKLIKIPSDNRSF